VKRLALGLVLVSFSAVHAQSGSDAYAAGVTALERGESEVAERHFREAVAAEPRVPHALALAATLQERGAFVEAVTWYDRLAAGEFGPLQPAQAQAIAAARELADDQVVSLHVGVEGAPRARILVDAEEVGEVRAGHRLTVRVDPGTHLVRATLDARTAERELTLSGGADRVVSLRLPAAPPPPPSEPAPPEEPDPLTEDVARRPAAPWVVLGLGLATLGAAAATGLVAQLRIGDARESSHRDATPLLDEAQTFGTVANVGFAVGGALAILGVSWVIVSRRSEVEVAVSGTRAHLRLRF